MQKHDAVIIGAGPAGLNAAIALRKHDLNVLVIDEFPHLGGRLLGQLHEEPNGEWWNGIKEAEKLVNEAKALNTEILTNVSVHHIQRKDGAFVVHTNRKNYEAKNVLIATGAAETANPIPGWTLPGVMTIGAAQVMTNVHRVRVGEKGIVIGVNVLAAAIARELLLAGIRLHSLALPINNAVTDEQSHPKMVMERLSRIAHLAPSPLLRFGGKFAKYKWAQNIAVSFYPKKGINMWDVPIHLRKAVKEINGTEQVESVTMVDITKDGEIIPGTEEEIPVDFVCIAGGLYPLAELAAVVGVPFKYVEPLGGHVPVHNEKMETPVEGVYVAGNITGIESAKVARAQGKVAGLSIAFRMKKDAAIQKEIEKAMDEVKTTRDNATIQFHPEIARGRDDIHAQFNKYLNG